VIISGKTVEFSAPQYEPNTSYFGSVMHNITLIDNSLAGAEEYTKPNIPLLVDVLIAKVLNDEKSEELMKYKKRTGENAYREDSRHG